MRFIIPISLLVGCTMETSLTGEEEILITALSGEEEVFSNHDIAARGMHPSEDMPLMFRECNAEDTFERLFAEYDKDSSSELEEEEENKVCDKRNREGAQQKRAKNMMKLLLHVYDTDEDHILGSTEKKELYTDFSERCEQLHAKLLEEFDVDGNGVLSDIEKESAKEEAKTRREEGDRYSEEKEGWDEDKDEGYEKKGKKKGLPPFAKEFDIDEDGKLDDSEKESFRTSMKEKIRSGEPFGKDCGEE